MIDREAVMAKYGGRCAYCGCKLGQRWQVDHIKPKRNGGTDDFINLNPSCCRCNNRKSVLTVEQFRHEIELQVERLERSSPQYRLARDFRLVQGTGNRVMFYFEPGEQQ